MPESVTDRPTKAHEYIFLLTKSAKYYYDADAIKEGHAESSLERHKYPNEKKAQGGKNEFGVFTYPKGYLNPSGRNKRSVWTIPTQPMPEAHFATFPKKLIEPCILSGSSEKGCCVECGAPCERETEISKKYHRKPGYKANSLMAQKKDSMTNFYPDSYSTESKTTGWKPGCKCNADTEPCTMLDIFGGSMTSAVVAYKHNRKFIMIELSESYIKDIGVPRIEAERKQLKLF